MDKQAISLPTSGVPDFFRLRSRRYWERWRYGGWLCSLGREENFPQHRDNLRILRVVVHLHVECALPVEFVSDDGLRVGEMLGAALLRGLVVDFEFDEVLAGLANQPRSVN